jgi:hypothetical protein
MRVAPPFVGATVGGPSSNKPFHLQAWHAGCFLFRLTPTTRRDLLMEIKTVVEPRNLPDESDAPACLPDDKDTSQSAADLPPLAISPESEEELRLPPVVM